MEATTKRVSDKYNGRVERKEENQHQFTTRACLK
jgi:hypothetical protein